jgi:anti-sigma factor RsiW
MNSPVDRRDQHGLHSLTGAYALDAVAGEEREEFEGHLTECDACAQEVRELTATAARLGLAAPRVPLPAESAAALRSAVLREVARTRQEPPAVSDPPAAARRTPWRPYRLALAACLALAAALGGVAVWQHQEADSARTRADRAEAEARSRAAEVSGVLTAPDARTVSARLAHGGTGAVVVSKARDRAVFVGSGLPKLSGGRVYQLWFDDAGTMRPAGLVSGTAITSAVPASGPIGRASGLGITVEPAGGSRHPTTAPLAVLSFT